MFSIEEESHAYPNKYFQNINPLLRTGASSCEKTIINLMRFHLDIIILFIEL